HETLITKGAPYSLETLIKERKRIDFELNNLGYYYFDPDYLIFEADSLQGNHRVKLKLVLKNDNPEESAKSYKINQVFVAEDFRLKNYHPDTSSFENYTMITAEKYMKPDVLLNSVFLHTDSLYSKKDHNNTLRQLMGIGAYKYVNARYAESPGKKNTLDALLMLTPSQKMSVSTELNAVNKSNNFAGPGMKLSFKSRNFLRGAEVFSVNFNGRFEKQISGDKEGDTAYEVSVDANLDVPRIIPFKTKKISKPYVPFTSFMIGSGIYTRVSLYKFNTLNTGMEYTWKNNQFITHKFKPIDISVTELLEASDEFKEYLLLNPSIRKSFEEQFIIGASYNFIFNHLSDSKKKQYYFSFGADPSGNIVGLIHMLSSGESTSPENPAKIFGRPVSQYYRFRIDARYYIKTGKESRVATRLFGGIGLPYGNSTVMPYVKQFYSGGTNSIRAFRARSLGPGSYLPPDSLANVL
ncbi:MAG: BamA/TamA family outer membrane protein, partial [Cyclobacteriaceae bacterium]|nr:BamA/TamA family outer membrane protein [Cyclobacteriaceae bacterium]